jgi:regulator of nucleoside diphosphate kinase
MTMANHHELLVSFPDAAALGLMLGERRRNHALEMAAADALGDLLMEARLIPKEALPVDRVAMNKLERAVVVSSEAVPADVATMNSRVRYTDGEQQRVARLAYPASAGGPGLLSVLSPVGAALLGLTAGERADYALGDGTVRRLRLDAVLDQPERALRRRSLDERLDEGLELTYPASDPLAVSP